MSQQADKTVFDLWGNMFDPFGVWQAARQNEGNQYVKLTSELLHAYTQTTNKVVDVYIGAFQPFQEFIETTTAPALKQLNLATRAELDALEERVASLEQRVDERSGTFEDIKQAFRKRGS